ncbi:MAG: hypothetical protein ABEI99_12155 [Halobaculum sp.]
MIRGVVLDVDGTLVTGDEPLPGAAAGIDAIRTAGLPFAVCSNNPTKGAEAYVERLGEAGFDVSPSAVVTAATATVGYLRENHPRDPIYVFGAASVRERLAEAGLRLVDDPADATRISRASRSRRSISSGRFSRRKPGRHRRSGRSCCSSVSRRSRSPGRSARSRSENFSTTGRRATISRSRLSTECCSFSSSAGSPSVWVS